MQRLLLLFGFFASAALSCRAQINLSPTTVMTLPAGHSFIADVRGAQGDIVVFTLDEVWTSPAGSQSWAKIGSFRGLGVRPSTASHIALRPGDTGYWYVSAANGDDQASLYRVRVSPPNQGSVPFAGFDEVPKQVKIAADGKFYLLDRFGQVWRADDFALTNLTRLTNSLAGAQDLSLGRDGSIFVLDNTRQVYRFSGSGNLLGQFTLSHNTSGANTPVFDVSSTGYLYAMDLGSAYSSIYDSLTGDYLGRFAFDSTVNDPRGSGGYPSMQIWVNGLTGAEMMVATTGSGSTVSVYNLSAIPEPATWTLLAGVSALGVVLIRRRQRRPDRPSGR